jgi:hypothetical protein
MKIDASKMRVFSHRTTLWPLLTPDYIDHHFKPLAQHSLEFSKQIIV